MRTDKKLEVWLKECKVGTLAMTKNHKVAFAYDDQWLKNGFSISPFSLPLKKEVFVPSKDNFNGLFGVFADSLPDAWGNLLLDRMLKKNQKKLTDITVIDRLAIVGKSGMGALCYIPEQKLVSEEISEDLDELSDQCQRILNTEYSDKLDELYLLGGTSGGARPKIMTEIDHEAWIIKFSSHVDGKNAGKMEYDYAMCAKKCGIIMSEVKLFPSTQCKGYFGTKRFDRNWNKNTYEKKHMLTAAALLELDFNQPSLDYHSLMKLTKILTGNNQQDLENMFRRMCFNVFAHNRDDHSKNFTYIYQEEADQWRLSPAYDLTYSNTYYGEHTTTIDGNGRNPDMKDILNVGQQAGMKKNNCEKIANEIRECVQQELGEYL